MAKKSKVTWHSICNVRIHTELAMEVYTAALCVRALDGGTTLCYRLLDVWRHLLFSSLRTRNHVPAIVIDAQRLFAAPSRDGSVKTHLFLIASLRPILFALFTASARFTLPIWRRFILDGFGNFIIHSGTVDPDWSRTFAILGGKSAFDETAADASHGQPHSERHQEHLRLEERRVFVGEVRDGLPLSSSTTSTTYVIIACQHRAELY